MGYKSEELRPSKPIILVDNRQIYLSLLTLEKEVFIIDTYGSMAKLISEIEKEPLKILEVIWLFLIDKKEYKYSPENFKNYLYAAREPLPNLARKCMSAFDEIRIKSAPLIKNIQRYKDINAINSTTADSSPCYVTYYDSLAKRYGYTLDTFFNLTLRQVHMLLKTANDESYKELEVKANLAGRKLKPRIVYEDITEEQDKENEAHAMDAVARLRKEYEEKQGRK